MTKIDLSGWGSCFLRNWSQGCVGFSLTNVDFSFIAGPSTEDSSHRMPASPGMVRESYDAQDSDKINAVY